MSDLKRQLGLGTATSVVIANMIGAGIFTTTGLMLAEVRSPALVLLVWFLGGMIALAGALCYAELAAAMPRAGAEYLYLREIYGPLPAFLTGWTSFFVGFSAPIAASAAGGGQYLAGALMPGREAGEREVAARAIGAAAVILFSLIHASGVRFGSRVQNALTLLKVSLLGAMLLAGFASAAPPGRAGATGEPRLAGVGISLLWAMFAYSGWNAAAYLGEEVERPERTLPRALLSGTLAVMLIYLGVNAQLLASPSVQELVGEVNVFQLALRQLFGEGAGRGAAVLVFLTLLSSLSAFVFIGPRVYFAMARDGLFFRAAAAIHPRFGTPARAIWAQAAFAVLVVLISAYDKLLTYIGFALGIFPMMAVAGVILLRRREPGRARPYRVWGYPFTPLFFLASMLAILTVSFFGRRQESLIALATVAAGIPAYWLLFRPGRRRPD
jgi:APA family basic amino acid/polyamine antiporter